VPSPSPFFPLIDIPANETGRSNWDFKTCWRFDGYGCVVAYSSLTPKLPQNLGYFCIGGDTGITSPVRKVPE
jgi:hypothetical protein